MAFDISIEAQDGTGSFGAYVARPKTDANAPVIIAIQEIFGVNAGMREICDTLADQGYIAICPDLFWRHKPGIELTDKTDAELQQAFDLFGSFDMAKGIEDLKATYETAKTLPGSTGRVGAVGYCLGGFLAYMVACNQLADATVSYYGVSIESTLQEADNIASPLMLHIAKKDQFVSPEAQEKIHTGLGTNKFVSLYSYDADHAFARPNGNHYDSDCATLANKRTADFFAAHLK
ncbi:carboxymethylenebutenolidase [Kordiimonas sediminis]|uniref:Carboxymethylenebutenolidase n=1 Tax=Kordiimonas sediminis TaxID=1735581 RepID=A0A919ALL1_9PROT|nr:dienelactone hydrolase family protein [Kordiimonas sediminis]GHF15544.1 carboxymethylenebutenolidase [Kordiimonas sediminis]